MWLLYADETNLDPKGSKFFLYGGIALSVDVAPSLHRSIEHLRSEFGYGPDDDLKFNTRDRPDHVDPDTHKQIKQKVLHAAAEHAAEGFFSLISHNIATSPEQARVREINRVCYHFDCALHRKDSHGLVFLDTFTDKNLHSILREKFHVGLLGLPYSERYRLERILGVHLATIGSSHFASVADIALGALRFVANSFQDDQKRTVCERLVRQLGPIFHRDGSPGPSALGLHWSPKTINHAPYAAEYRELFDFFTSAGFRPEAEPG